MTTYPNGQRPPKRDAVDPRRRFIQTHAHKVRNLDV
jgi:hypothetical protein